MWQRRAHGWLMTLVVVCACVARAADEPGFLAPNANISLTGGVALRAQGLRGGPTTSPISVGGFSPTVLRLRGDWWFAKVVSLEGDFTSDLYATRPKTEVMMGTDDLVRRHARLDARLGLGLRLVTKFGLILSSGVGFSVSRQPYLAWMGTTLTEGTAFSAYGPTLRAGAAFYVSKLELNANVTAVIGFGQPILLSLEPSGYVGWRFLELNDLGLTLGFDYSFISDRALGIDYGSIAHRFTLGLRLSFLPPKPATVVQPTEAPTTVRVTVTLPDGQPAAGASATLDGVAPEQLDARGERVMTVTPGMHEVKVSLTGYRVASQRVNAAKGVESRVVLELAPLTGPGKLSGVVTAAATKKPIAGATVSVGEDSTKTDDHGAWTFAAVGPGPVKVRIEAQGFNSADEVAQVPPEGEATLDATLEALGKGSPATVRGLIRSRTGDALKASVVIKGLSTKVPVNSEGRFVVTIPGGEYFFVISAPGYVSQTKKVTLADGDQAIFHCELQKVTK